MSQHPDPGARTDDIDTAEVLGGGANLDPTSKPHPESMGGGVQDPLGAKVEHLAAAAGRERPGERPDANVPIGFEDARRLVEAVRGPTWDVGSYMVADWGREDATHWLVISGAREWLVDRDAEFSLAGGGCALVDKQTGEIEWVAYVPSTSRIEAMWPISEQPDRTSSDL